MAAAAAAGNAAYNAIVAASGRAGARAGQYAVDAAGSYLSPPPSAKRARANTWKPRKAQFAGVYGTTGHGGSFGSRRRRYGRRRRAFGRKAKRYGRSLGKFSKRRRFGKIDVFQKYGAVLKREDGGVVNSQECQYLGVASAPVATTVICVCRAIVKKLAQKMEIDFEDWDKIIPVPTTTWRLTYFFYPNAIDNTPTFRNIAIGATDTWDVLAINLQQDWDVAITSGMKPIMEKVLIENNAGNITYAQLLMKQFYLDVYTSGRISIQNRTAGGTSLEQADNRNEITSNPLIGKAYFGNGNAFVQRSMTGSGAGDFVAASTSGLLVTDATVTMPRVLSKPPPASFFLGAKTASAVKINPGVIKTISVRRFQKMAFNSFFQSFARSIAGPSAQYKWSVGKVVLLGLEKAIDSRGLEPDIVLAHQTDLTIKIKGSYSDKVVTSVLQDIN
jgi:hypothetical protein